MPISKERKAVVHLAKAQLGLADGDYRALLQRVAGVRSSSDLDDAGFDAVMGELECLGFRSVKHRTPAARREGMATPATLGRIRGLWKAYTGTDDEAALERWLERYLRASSLRFLDARKGGAVVAILERLVAKRRANRSGDQEREKTGAQQ